MLGLMMDGPLLIPNVLEYAASYHPAKEIVSRNEDSTLHRYGYADAAGRVRQLANALNRLGLEPGDRVATLAWNNHRHFELYYGIPGTGLVCHTINPRLFPEQLVFILNDAQDKYLFADAFFAPLVAGVAPHAKGLRGIVFMCDRAHMPKDLPATLPPVLCYEDLLAAETDQFDWPQLDERTAAGLCYTSGTTGNPKGVLYSHRSTVLHALGVNQPGLFGISPEESVLPVVPMFHVNAWGIPYAAAMVGARLVFPGPRLDGPGLLEIIHGEKVTLGAGVPTIWLNLLNHADQAGQSVAPMRRVVVGGAACPQTLIERFAAHKALAVHAWGMTETSPLGSVSVLSPNHEFLAPADKVKLLLKQGRAPFGIEMRITGPDGKPMPWDGVARGDLEVRGPWIAGGYFNNDDRSQFTDDGWFRTGDISTIDAEGFMNIVDRSKDVIKSGGEWISSIELENLAMSHPSVLEAAVIARVDTRWSERPRYIIALRDGKTLSGPELRAFIAPHIASWWIPEDMILVKELPHGGTGKVLKVDLRARYGAEHHPEAIRLAE